MIPDFIFYNFTEIHNFLMGLSVSLVVVWLRHHGRERLATLVVVLSVLAALIAWSDTWRLHAWYAIVPFAVVLTISTLLSKR
jgi:hypothetical protein